MAEMTDWNPSNSDQINELQTSFKMFPSFISFQLKKVFIIFANRRIARGEELSYDYKFDYEDENRIPCLCGAKNCVKWMN